MTSLKKNVAVDRSSWSTSPLHSHSMTLKWQDWSCSNWSSSKSHLACGTNMRQPGATTPPLFHGHASCHHKNRWWDSDWCERWHCDTSSHSAPPLPHGQLQVPTTTWQISPAVPSSAAAKATTCSLIPNFSQNSTSHSPSRRTPLGSSATFPTSYSHWSFPSCGKRDNPWGRGSD